MQPEIIKLQDLERQPLYRDCGRYVKCYCPFNCLEKRRATFIWYKDKKSGKCYNCEAWAIIEQVSQSPFFRSFFSSDMESTQFGVAWAKESSSGKEMFSMTLDMASAPNFHEIMMDLSVKNPEDTEKVKAVTYDKRDEDKHRIAYANAIRNVNKTKETAPDYSILSDDIAIYNDERPLTADAEIQAMRDSGSIDEDVIKTERFRNSVGAMWINKNGSIAGNITIKGKRVPVFLVSIAEDERAGGMGPTHNVMIGGGGGLANREKSKTALSGIFGGAAAPAAAAPAPAPVKNPDIKPTPEINYETEVKAEDLPF